MEKRNSKSYKDGKDSYFDDSICEFNENSNFWLNETEFLAFQKSNFIHPQNNVLLKGILKNRDFEVNEGELLMNLTLTPSLLIYLPVIKLNYFFLYYVF